MIRCLDIRDRNAQAGIKVEINSQKVWVLINKTGAAVYQPSLGRGVYFKSIR